MLPDDTELLSPLKNDLTRTFVLCHPYSSFNMSGPFFGLFPLYYALKKRKQLSNELHGEFFHFCVYDAFSFSFLLFCFFHRSTEKKKRAHWCWGVVCYYSFPETVIKEIEIKITYSEDDEWFGYLFSVGSIWCSFDTNRSGIGEL